jgi:translation initiation factor 2 beta subunit (eIF-2beta)/eIF-5
MRCEKCGSHRVYPHFAVSEPAYLECVDCGATYPIVDIKIEEKGEKNGG